jgi:hypothetical protein
MFVVPTYASLVAFLAFWALVGICPENWPRRWPPPPIPDPGPRPDPLGPGPRPPPLWAKFVGIGGAILAGFAFAGAAPAGVGTSPSVDFALTGIFALAGAFGAREVAGRLAPAAAPQAVTGLQTPGTFRG